MLSIKLNFSDSSNEQSLLKFSICKEQDTKLNLAYVKIDNMDSVIKNYLEKKSIDGQYHYNLIPS